MPRLPEAPADHASVRPEAIVGAHPEGYSRGRRARIYPAVGMALAAGSPLGHLVLRALCSPLAMHASWFRSELTANGLTYAYLAVSTTIVFALLGWLLGRKEDRLESLASTDALTGLANRGHFGARLASEVTRAARYGSPLAVLLLDVDHLKPINDRGGHAAGDAALRAVAESLEATCRTTDLPARVGGDEFAVLAPATTSVQAARLGERVREQLRRMGAGVTVSVGIADASDARVPDATALLRAADDALYVAKFSGRDAVVVAGAHAERQSRSTE